jgi:hypothetical protein
MKCIPSAIVAVFLAAAIMPAQAQQRPYAEGAVTPKAVGDPMIPLYSISGVRDNGAGGNSGVATTFDCTSLSTVNETVQFTIRNFNGDIIAAPSFTIMPNRTLTVSTHFTNLFFEDAALSRGKSINSGSARISATSTDIICSAMIVDAAVGFPEGIALHLVRFNPIAGTEE